MTCQSSVGAPEAKSRHILSEQMRKYEKNDVAAGIGASVALRSFGEEFVNSCRLQGGRRYFQHSVEVTFGLPPLEKACIYERKKHELLGHIG
jgi:hypothetical protein